ncbi:MAG: hypothetical protein ACK40A_19245, partial [Pannonibacter indicus]
MLDMCSGPGGKSSHLATLMRNEGLLVGQHAGHASQRVSH